MGTKGFKKEHLTTTAGDLKLSKKSKGQKSKPGATSAWPSCWATITMEVSQVQEVLAEGSREIDTGYGGWFPSPKGIGQSRILSRNTAAVALETEKGNGLANPPTTSQDTVSGHRDTTDLNLLRDAYASVTDYPAQAYSMLLLPREE